MDEKDIQYLSLLIMQLHLQIGRMERDNRELKEKLDQMSQLNDTQADPGQEN